MEQGCNFRAKCVLFIFIFITQEISDLNTEDKRSSTIMCINLYTLEKLQQHIIDTKTRFQKKSLHINILTGYISQYGFRQKSCFIINFSTS